MAAGALVLAAPPAMAETRQIEADYRGFKLVGVLHPPGTTFDIPHLETEKAFDITRKAIDTLYAASPFSRNEIAKLKKGDELSPGLLSR